MEYNESDVKNLIAVGYLSGVVDAFGKGVQITPEDMKSRMMKSNTIRSSLVDNLSNIDAVALVKSGKSIASGVLKGDNTAAPIESHSTSLFQRAENAIGSIFKSSSPPPAANIHINSALMPGLNVTAPVVPVVPVVATTPSVNVTAPVVPNASVVNPMNQAAPPAPYTPTPNVIGGRRKNKSRKQKKSKKTKKSRK